MVCTNHENIFTTKISRSMVYMLYIYGTRVHVHVVALTSSIALYCIQDLHVPETGAYGSGEGTPNSLRTPTPTPSNHSCPSQSVPEPGKVQYKDVVPRPSNALPSQSKDMESKKGPVVYAELGAKPASAPAILPPDRPVQYMTLKSATNDMVSMQELACLLPGCWVKSWCLVWAMGDGCITT